MSEPALQLKRPETSRDDAKLLLVGASRRGWHRLQTAAECLQRYAWSYRSEKALERMAKRSEPGSEFRFESPNAHALVRGSLFHLAMAHHYRRMQARQMGEDEEEWCSPREAVALIAQVNGVDAHGRDIIRVYDEYERRTDGEEHSKKIIGVEHLLETMIDGKYLFTGRLDLIYEDLDGRVWVVDHKCQPASARVMTDEGPKTIGELVAAGQPWQCSAWDEKHSTPLWSPASLPVEAGVQDVYAVKLENGVTEEFGYQHPVWTTRGWVQAQDLRSDDLVGIAQPPDNVEYADVSDAELWLLAKWISDGSAIGKDGSLVITALAEEDRQLIAAKLVLTGNDFTVVLHRQVPKGIRIHRGPFYDFLIKNGLDLAKKADAKSLPELIGRLSRRQIGRLLGGLWEGDGGAYFGTVGKSGHRPVRIQFSTRSRKLAQQVHELLLRFGLLSNLCTTTAVQKPYYQALVVGKESKLLFLRKAMAGDIDCPVAARRGGKTRSGAVRPSFSDLEAALLIPRVPRSDARNSDTLTPKQAAQQAFAKRYHQIRQKIHDEKVKHRPHNPKWVSGVRWVAIEAITKKEPELCYAIEVADHHTFMTASGVITHNSSSRLTSSHRDNYAISGQLMGYAHMAREHFGAKFAGVKLNLVELSDKPHFDLFASLPRSPELETRFVQTVIDIEESIERMELSGRAVEDWPKAMSELVCIHRYGPCAHIDKCRFGPAALPGGDWKWAG